ncbi:MULTISPECIES: hypothetical protein [Halobacteriovorax]|nr:MULTISPECIES: hypothetical protein [Halobacteriovorax]AYF43781.1 hypothetical protein BALOs_0771 [Halobacteriovorax sp. BALOs_7]
MRNLISILMLLSLVSCAYGLKHIDASKKSDSQWKKVSKKKSN